MLNLILNRTNLNIPKLKSQLPLILSFLALTLLFLALYNNLISIFIVKSGSMEPTIKKQSLVIVAPKSIYKVDDIITYRKSNTTITHRLVEKIGEDTFKTKGDHNDTADLDFVKEGSVVGKVILVLPFFGILTTKGFLILATSLMGGWYGYSYFTSKKNAK